MAHVMKPPRIPTGPYPDNQYIPTSTHGWVHANTWYANVPFNSAPPPAPAGINPQTWANGHWQPNPYFRPPQTQPTQSGFQMWAPHPGWGNNAGGQQNWNPYKRVPNPGDASYWATELSDNPLKLENMHIRDDTPAEERHRKDSPNGVPHTPWVWVPKELSSDTSKSAENTGTSGSHDGQSGQRQYEQSQKDLPQAPQSHRREHTYDHTRANSGPRAYTSPPTAIEPSVQSRHYQHGHTRSASTVQDRAPPSSAPATVSTYSAYHQQQQQQQQYQQQPQASDRYPDSSQQHAESGQHHRRQQSRNVSPRQTYDSQPPPSRDYRNAPTSSASSSASAAAAAAASRYSNTDSAPSASNERERELGRNEGFNARRELQPTFSPKIVRTPDHYYTTPNPSRHTSHDDLERTPRHSSSTPAHGPIYGPPSGAPTRSNSLNHGRQSTPAPGSIPAANANSSLGLINLNQSLTDEPESVLSPLIVPSTPPDSTRPSPRGGEVGRNPTYPSVAFDYVPEERDRQVYRKTPREYPRAISREPSDRERDQRERERDRDRERERERRRDYSRTRDVDATPQPGARTPPTHTPPLSHYTRPSPDRRTGATPISRSQTYPAVIPPPPITPQRSRSPGRSPRYSPSQSQPPSSYSSPYGQSAAASYSRTSPNPAPTSISSASSPLRHNPLPRPPQASPYAEQLTRGSSSASAAAVATQQQPRRQVRGGFWNRRGDHLHVNEKGERFIVYAPRHLANPEDLKHYPSPTEGWQDHRGAFVRYDPNVPELLDSLPVHGEAPKRPYQSFVQYVTV